LSGGAGLREEYGRVKQYLEESLVIFREIGDRSGVATCLNSLGEGFRRQGRYKEAVRYYEESLAIERELGFDGPAQLNNLGHAYIGLGEDDTAWECLHEALRVSLANRYVLIAMEGLVGVAWLWTKAGQQVQAAELLGLVLGHSALNEEIKYYAEPVLAMVREALPANELEAALERGKALDLEQVVAEILEEAE
jgi:tetratricopeptide (TPR) repeat protein